MIRSVHEETVMQLNVGDISYRTRLELLQASRVCQLKLEVLSCSHLLDVKKDLMRVSKALAPWL